MADDEALVEIDASGALRASPGAARILSDASGVYRLVPSAGRLLVLKRASVPARERDREVVLAGSFATAMVLPTILNLIQMAQWDGALTVSAPNRDLVLFFRRGVYLSGSSSDEDHRLGAILVREGLLEPAQVDELVGSGDGERFGRAVVRRGWLTNTGVYDGLRAQAEEIFVAALRAAEGTFHLVAPLDMTEVPAMLRLDLQQLLIDGMRRIDEEAAAREAELRRARPVAPEALPRGGAGVIATYNDAMQRLFAALPGGARETVHGEVAGFLAESAPYRALFADVGVADDGTLDDGALAANLETLGDEGMTLLQLGLNEMLFFAMFSAGDALDPAIEHKLQADIAAALAALPKPEGAR